MVVKEKLIEDGLEERDEAWWASVLADEKNIASTAAVPPSVEPKNESLVDWAKIQKLYRQDVLITLRVIGHNRGGVLVAGENVSGFVPYSHLLEVKNDIDPDTREKTLAAYVHRELTLKVIECAPEESRIVFSERAAQAGAGRRQELFASLQPGQRISGKVTNITNFGVFVDLGGVEGLIHISELSWGRVNHPAETVHLHEQIDVQVLEVLPERCRVALSLKRLFDNPWEEAEQRYAVGQVVPATITTIVSFGVFARLDDGLEGLIHISEIPVVNGVLQKDVLRKGQILDVRILRIDSIKQRMGLSLNLGGEF
ncbi:MAG: S1 RNA-binding domain-containing protein [Anaerolineales bacterium]|nr:S1 RNA-binding domain-containing protein [Anaerolineales bacterium]